jgi:hypothetical protein
MGDTEPGSGETHRTTIEISGPIDKQEFEKYKAELRECLRKWLKYKARIRVIECEKD